LVPVESIAGDRKAQSGLLRDRVAQPSETEATGRKMVKNKRVMGAMVYES
jgi:hypothetical protein